MQWQDVLADKSLQDLPYKIELNERGKIEMSPASFIHSFLQAELAKRLGVQLEGRVFTELAIQTSQGIKVPDVAWGNESYFRQNLHATYALTAPDICIEIISPSNNQREMQQKIALYLEAGAIEIWLVDELGNIRFFNAQGQQSNSEFTVIMDSLI